MTSADRSFFFKSLEEFQEERGEDSGPPLFAKKAVDQWRLWLAVQESGGHAEVTQNKGWARIGRLFDPPKTMTDLSFRIKKIYEVHMLPFEKAVDEGRIQGVYKPLRVATPQHQPAASRAGRTTTKRASTGKAPTPGVSARPKRARRDAGPKNDEELIGKDIKIFWPAEKRYFKGRIIAFDKDLNMHSIDYDDGDTEVLDLSEHTWHIDGAVDGDIDQKRLSQLRSEADALEDEDCFDDESDDDLPAPRAAAELPKDCIADRVTNGRGYKVFLSPDKLAYEIFCLVPGLSLDSIRVKAWESGKVLAAHPVKSDAAKLETTSGQLKALRYRIRLPSDIMAAATQAIITLHGQLYIKAPIKGAAVFPTQATHIPQGESAVQAVPSETLEQETKPSELDDEAAISPDRSNAISPDKAAGSKQELENQGNFTSTALGGNLQQTAGNSTSDVLPTAPLLTLPANQKEAVANPLAAPPTQPEIPGVKAVAPAASLNGTVNTISRPDMI